MFINRLRMSKGKLFKLFDLQSTLALRTPRYYGHHPLGDKSQTPGETHKEIAEITPVFTDSRYYENLASSKLQTHMI